MASLPSSWRRAPRVSAILVIIVFAFGIKACLGLHWLGVSFALCLALFGVAGAGLKIASKRHAGWSHHHSKTSLCKTPTNAVANLKLGIEDVWEASVTRTLSDLEGLVPEADVLRPQLIFRIKVPEGIDSKYKSVVRFEGPDHQIREVRLPSGLKPGDIFTVADGSYQPVQEFLVENPTRGGPKESPWISNSLEQVEAGLGSLILLMCAGISLGLANWAPTAPAWLSFWQMRLGPAITPPWTGGLTLQTWVNEGLMALFFFSVGLEIKKEMAEGSLATPKKALLPCVAALGGMVVPMAINATLQHLLGGPVNGVAIPMATDIAFAMGIFYSCRRFMPRAAESLLLALATVDDLGAIVVIAVWYPRGISWNYLCTAAGILGCTALSGKQGVKNSWGFLVPGVLLWYCLLRGGINADIAGVLTAFCIPLRSIHGSEVVRRLIRRWALGSAFLVLPLFALANCCVPLHVTSMEAESGRLSQWAVPLGVLLGLLLGKPLGIFIFSWASVKAKLTAMPAGMGNQDLLAIGMLGSIGFTMCLFLIENSLQGSVAGTTKIAVFTASGLGGLLSIAFMIGGKKR